MQQLSMKSKLTAFRQRILTASTKDLSISASETLFDRSFCRINWRTADWLSSYRLAAYWEQIADRRCGTCKQALLQNVLLILQSYYPIGTENNIFRSMTNVISLKRKYERSLQDNYFFFYLVIEVSCLRNLAMVIKGALNKTKFLLNGKFRSWHEKP